MVRVASGCPFHQSGQGRSLKHRSDTPLWASAHIFVLPVAKAQYDASGFLRCALSRGLETSGFRFYICPQNGFLIVI